MSTDSCPSGSESDAPQVIILAGPNGAGKSTAAPGLLKGLLDLDDFVNADVIAQGLSGFAPEAVALEAGEVMLRRIHRIADQRGSFAFETTLASRSYAAWLRELAGLGYHIHLSFLWLSSPELAVRRVAQRVRFGGHSVPEATIRRRYRAGLHNFFALYQPPATTWRVYDNSETAPARLVAAGQGGKSIQVVDRLSWDLIQEAGR